MIEDIFNKIISNPENYNIIVDECDVTVYDKSNGDTHRFGRLPEDVLHDLLKAMGVEVERL